MNVENQPKSKRKRMGITLAVGLIFLIVVLIFVGYNLQYIVQKG